MSDNKVFDSEIPLPDDRLSAREPMLLGFDARYARVHDQLRLLLQADELAAWNKKHHGGRLALASLATDQYPLVIFHGDVGTGKTVTAECIANRLVSEAGADDSILFKLSNRVRGSGLVGEMGTQLVEAFRKIEQSAGKHRRAILVIDEGDSLGASRSQAHSHHEDKVAVNTLIQEIDQLRRLGGRIVVFLCTNRLSVLDPALRRRAAVIEEFRRPTESERHELLSKDLAALNLSKDEIARLVAVSGEREGDPPWTFSDIRTRFYPAALAMAFPCSPLTFAHLEAAATAMRASPRLED
ncbi:MAG TPA: ATP-binding protein [Acetobacteraceae bacterium]|nr:ATP-binding protein [Acetobacteraceae bacterium]